jgi:hypothetical protein
MQNVRREAEKLMSRAGGAQAGTIGKTEPASGARHVLLGNYPVED